MSWMQKLYETYEACNAQKQAGKLDETAATLMPIYHTTQQAQVEVTIDENGNWIPGGAIALAKDDQETLIPCTEKSANRTSSPEPMPLFDKLPYVAGDFNDYCEEKKGSPHQLYLESLRAWCASSYAHPDARAWLRYAEKGRLIQDLIAESIFETDENGKLAGKWKGTGKAQDAFIRFQVRHTDGTNERVWENPEISQKFIAYQESLPAETDLCYVLGREMPVSQFSPKYIRYPGDGAKLVSANDSGGFTFRGRLQTAEEALALGRETTEKAHAALKYLIRKQAYRNGDQVILTFGTGGVPAPSPTEDTVGLVGLDMLYAGLAEKPVFTLKESIAREVNKAIAGYRNRLDPQAEVIVMGLDSATTGRLSIFYYRELRAEDFFTRILRWHETCTWLHRYRSVPDGVNEKGKTVYRPITFVGAPAPEDIVKAAYGETASDKLMKNGVERLLPCIVDGARLPKDIVSAAARRAAQRNVLSNWEREKALSIACALIRKQINDQKNKEVWEMALQEEVTDRSYLFGRAWAYAEAIERYALQQAAEKRDTNAERLMTAFPRHPVKSWGVLMERLRPYQNKLGQRASSLNEGMDRVIAALETAGFTNEPLTEIYLLGYACQRQAFAKEREQRKAAKAEMQEEEN